MNPSIPAIRPTRNSMMLLAAIALLVAFLVSASTASAFHCYVEDKPNGAGSVTFEDLKVAGNSGKLVAPGAFVDTSVTGLDHDIFIRGKPVPGEEPFVVGEGSLPDQAHDSGNTSHGVQALEFDDED